MASMNNNKYIPKIRFKGFDEEWRSELFSEVLLPMRNNTLSRADLNYQNGLVNNLHYGDILIKFGECLDVKRERLPYITNKRNINELRTLRLQSGDVVFADTAEDETAGKCTELLNVLDKFVVAGLHTMPYHPKSSFANGYLGYFFNSNCYHSQLIPLMQGTKVISISKSAIKSTYLHYPDNKEQALISEYLQNIDKLITQSQSKLQKLKNIKKACLEKMFPTSGSNVPEIRFKGFAEEWTEKKLDEFCNVTIGEFVIQTKQHRNAPYPVYNGGMSYTGFYDEYNQEGNKVIISARGANAGFVNKSEQKYWAGNSCYSVGVLDTTDWFFLYYTIKKEEQYFRNIQHSANIPSVSKKQVVELYIKLPVIEEQKQISSFFKTLDNQITKNEQKLEKLKNIKKACLEKMFV